MVEFALMAASLCQLRLPPIFFANVPLIPQTS